MKVLLVSSNTETQNMTLPFGPACVAAATHQAGHEVRLLDLMFAQDAKLAITRAVAEFDPGVIGISVRNIDNQSMTDPRFLLAPARDVVAHCRALSAAPIVVGGAGYSIFPESALRYLGADIGVQGEGETVFPALLQRLASGSPMTDLPNICLPGRPVIGRTFAALEDMPLPAPGPWLRAAENPDVWVPVQTRRGCPMQCSFCSTATIQGTNTRHRPPQQVVAWLATLQAAGYNKFCFVDNTFNLPPSYAKELCRAIIRAGLQVRLWCIVYPNWVDAELVELMRRAGCCQVALGFESGAGPVLRNLNKRFEPKEVTAICRMFVEAGIERGGFLMLGSPGETRETVEQSLAFADSLPLDTLKITVGVRIYPDTALARTAVEEGVIAPEDDLLEPRFYLVSQLRDWLPGRIAAYSASRPWVD